MTFDADTRSLLEQLGSAVLPFRTWINAKQYEPPKVSELPWRQTGNELTPKKMGALPFLEALIRESRSDATLLERWNAIRGSALKFCPHENPIGWRRLRGLEPAATFGVLPGGNAPVDTEGNQIARAQFYSDYLPLVRAAAATRKPTTADDWTSFAWELFTDTCLEWPRNATLKSSTFLIQFTRDLMNAVLGMRNPIVEPWRSAVLTEIGEYRRPGNAFSRADVSDAIEILKKTIADSSDKDLVPLDALVREADVADIVTSSKRDEVVDSVKNHYLEFSKHGQ